MTKPNNTPTSATNLLNLTGLAPQTTIWIAYSGGLDSHVLLHAVAQLHLSQPVRVIHIHHGLQRIADSWVTHCEKTCAAMNLPLEVVHLHLQLQTGESVEALARTARYQAFADKLQKGDYLLTAQHADDQAETLLLQLLRGASASGLAAMPAKRALGKGYLLRPLLSQSRADLRNYAKAQQLSWIEDPSNQNPAFDRNYLRQRIMPLIKQRWQGAVKSLNRAAAHQADSLRLLRAISRADYQTCLLSEQRLAISALQQLSTLRQQQVLRYWIQQAGFPLPNQARLHSLQNSLNSRADRQLLLSWQTCQIRSYRQALYIHAALPAAPTTAQVLSWENLTKPLIVGLGTLSITKQHALWQAQTPLQIRFRHGGERLRYYQQDKSLKNLLQAAGIVPWLRPYLPLLYQGDELIAIPDVAVCDRLHHQAADCLSGLYWDKRI